MKAALLAVIAMCSVSFAGYVWGSPTKVRTIEDQSTNQQYVNIQLSNGNNYYFELKGRPVEDSWLSQIMLAQAKPAEIEFCMDIAGDSKSIYGRNSYRIQAINTHMR